MAYFLGQIPWLGVYLGNLPGVGGAISVVLAQYQKETAKRLASGSSNRDLFYYLVRISNLYSRSIHPSAPTEQRRPP